MGRWAWKIVDEYTGDWVRAARPGETEEDVGSIGKVPLLMLTMRVVVFCHLEPKSKNPPENTLERPRGQETWRREQLSPSPSPSPTALASLYTQEHHEMLGPMINAVYGS